MNEPFLSADADASVLRAERNFGDAVRVSDVHKAYGKVPVLKSFSMKVSTGEIYALLGPSGCGKTTLLKLLFGRLVADDGQIRVFGTEPGAKNSRVPGKDVGYAPQEIALYEELTIRETLLFHGRLHHMDDTTILTKEKELLSLLDLPSSSQLVGTLSGGQRRRVSVAVALLHNPRLLILDEPTVGVDPLLRTRLWSYLRDVASKGTTVIVTTHYIEEARTADVVGLMRDGHILAEDSPSVLMNRFGHETLEETFLALCRNVDRSGEKINDDALGLPKASTKRAINADPDCVIEEPRRDAPTKRGLDLSFDAARAWACARRSWIRMRRNRKVLVFETVLPTLQMCLFCLAIGRNPEDLPMAVVNQDAGVGNLSISNDFLQHLGSAHGGMFSLHPYTTIDAAVNSVRKGKTFGVIHMGVNFTQALLQRAESAPASLPASVFADSTAIVRLDMTDQELAQLSERAILESFQSTMDAVSPTPGASEIPVQFTDPIYGDTNPKFTDFVAPGMIAIISFVHALGLTSVAFVMERLDGTLDRVFATGCRPREVIVGHKISHLAVVAVQIVTLLIIAIFVFSIPIHGSVFWLFLIAFILAWSGVSYGLLISCVAPDVLGAMQIAMGTFFPSLLLSGVIWPAQGIPFPLNIVTKALPTTYAADAARNIMLKGWSIAHRGVWLSMPVSMAWGLFFLAIASFALRQRA